MVGMYLDCRPRVGVPILSSRHHLDRAKAFSSLPNSLKVLCALCVGARWRETRDQLGSLRGGSGGSLGNGGPTGECLALCLAGPFGRSSCPELYLPLLEGGSINCCLGLRFLGSVSSWYPLIPVGGLCSQPWSGAGTGMGLAWDPVC